MTHGYSLRPNAKGRQGHQSTDATNGQVEGTSTSASSSTSSTSEKGHDILTDELEGESDTVDPRPATPAVAHNTPAPRQDSEHQKMKNDWQPHSRGILTSSTISAATTTRYRVEGPHETWEEIQAAREREEARRIADAVRIRREQIVRGYEEELRTSRARIVALRSECEAEVARARRKWERAWAIERGEVAVVVDADGEMAVKRNFAPTETSLAATNDDEQWQQPPRWSRSESHFPPLPFRRTQRQLLSLRQIGISPTSPSHLPEPNAVEDEERGKEEAAHTGRQLPRTRIHPVRSQGAARPHHWQPLRRQPAQLMVIPTSSHGLRTDTHGTAIPDPEIRFGGTTDGDKDSEMGG